MKLISAYRPVLLAEIYAKFDKLKALEKNILYHLPPNLAEQCQVTDARVDTLTITVKNASFLNLVRYEKPQLLENLRKSSMPALRTIEFKLLDSHFTKHSRQAFKMPKEPIFSNASADVVHQMADSCDYIPLQEALNRLSETLARAAKSMT